MLPKSMLKKIPKDYFDESGTLRILHEDEWRGLGITQVILLRHLITELNANIGIVFRMGTL